jgi:zinc transporter ZupT
MRTATVATLLAVLSWAIPAGAQPRRDNPEHRVVKVLVGAGAIVIGAAVAAKSSNTTTVSSPQGTATTSSRSTSQLVTGLVVAGTGGFILWDGLRDHDHRDRYPQTMLGVSAGKSSGQLFVRKSW